MKTIAISAPRLPAASGGPEHLTALVEGLDQWLSANAFASVDEIRGRLDATHVDRADVFLRTQYLRTLSDYALHHAPVERRAALSRTTSEVRADDARVITIVPTPWQGSVSTPAEDKHGIS
jgi:hypothetical protein